MLKTMVMLVIFMLVNLFGKINYCTIDFTRFAIDFRSLDFFEFCLNLSCIHTCSKGGFGEGSLLLLFFLLDTCLSACF